VEHVEGLQGYTRREPPDTCGIWIQCKKQATTPRSCVSLCKREVRARVRKVRAKADRSFQTFSVNRELLDPSAEGRLLPRVPLGGKSGLGDCGGLRYLLLSSNGFPSLGCRMTGVLAGLGRKFSCPESRVMEVSPISFPNSFDKPAPP
jgi:hypothetical protein